MIGKWIYAGGSIDSEVFSTIVENSSIRTRNVRDIFQCVN